MEKKNINEQYKNWFSRVAPVNTEKAKPEDMIIPDGVLATEQPVIVFDWYRWEPVREILLMKGCRIPANNQVPLLDSHSRNTTSQIKGSVRNIRDSVDENNEPIKIADYHFEREAKRDYNLVLDKHLTDSSIGYKTYDEHTVIIAPTQSTIIEGKEYRNDYPDELPLLIRLVWDLMEDSLVAIGADDRAKFRSQFLNEQSFNIRNEPHIKPEEIEGIKQSVKEINESLIKIISKGDSKMDGKEKELSKEEILKAERSRIEEIEALGKKHNIDISSLIKDGSSIELARGFVLDKIGDKPLDTPVDQVDLSKKEMEKYSLLRAINFKLDPNKFAKSAGFEIEVSADIEKRAGQAPKGIYVPSFVTQRTMSVGLASNYGSDLVGTNYMPEEMIPLLRNKMLLAKLGARFLSGLVGNVAMPKWTSGATAAWTSTEGAGASNSTPGTNLLSLTPKEISANVSYTRQLLLQSDPSVDMLIRDDLLKVLGVGIDLAGYHGAGSSGQPQGIVGTTSVGTVDASSTTWAKMVSYETKVDIANALEGQFNFVTTPTVKGALKGAPKVSGYPVFMCGDDNKVNGYNMYSTNQISTGYILFGDFSQIMIGEWGGLDIYPVQAAGTGIITITAFKTVDIGVRYPGAFVVGSSFSI